jgi:uncharacterized membrane protein
VTHLDLKTIDSIATARECTVHVLVRPGAFVHPTSDLLRVDGPVSAQDELVLVNCVVIAATRTFDQDVRFGPIVLSEVAVRALAAASNDQGTAISVATILTRLLTDYATAVSEREPVPPRFPNVTVPSVDPGEFVRDGFEPIARNGVMQVELCVRLQKLLSVLRESTVSQIARAAEEVGSRAVGRSELLVPFAGDRDPVSSAASTRR